MDMRDFIFRNRSYIPIPLALTIIYFAGKGNLYPFGFSLIIIGELLRLNGVRYAGGATRTRNVGVQTLCTSGPFAYVRNPLYLGNVILYLGIVLVAGGDYWVTIMMVTALFFLIQYGLIISLEEKTLKRELGEPYILYYNAVPRIFPMLTRWKEGKTASPRSWANTLKIEKRTLQTLLGFLLLLLVRIQLFN